MKAIAFDFSDTISKSREIICKVVILNLNKISGQQVINSMFRVKNQTIPATFHEKFMQISKYPTTFSVMEVLTSLTYTKRVI